MLEAPIYVLASSQGNIARPHAYFKIENLFNMLNDNLSMEILIQGYVYISD